MVRRTEFFEMAVKAGFYGIERSGVFGKKDNVRKYWEDVFIKTFIRPSLESLLARTDKLRIVDLGAGSGEGMELLTHIPPLRPVDSSTSNPFLLSDDHIGIYEGLDLSPAMVAQGRVNYQDRDYVRFMEADLTEGFPLSDEPPFNVYFSSYCSLSHLTRGELEQLSSQIFTHALDGSVVVYDLYGRLSPEWPLYWSQSAREQLPYNMGYLLSPQEQESGNVDSFDVTFWTAPELIETIQRASAAAAVKINMLTLKDRSILVGRHMDTNYFKPMRLKGRNQVNHLFDRDYRGNIAGLTLDLSYLDACRDASPEAYRRIHDYYSAWSSVVAILDALMRGDNPRVRQLIESSPESLADDLKMLAWLYRNADRFPVVDFWASVMGPQVACVLRNLEFNLPNGVGCGHSLCAIVQVCK
jgi:SAM-dependent methyltransferase